MPYATIPAPLPPERDPGVVDVTEQTMPDPSQVADIRAALKRRDRNATPRTHEPDDAA